MQRIRILFIIICVLFICSTEVYGSTSQEEIENIMSEYTGFYGDIFDDEISKTNLNQVFNQLIPTFDIKSLFISLIKGEAEISFPKLFDFILKILLAEIYSCLKLMALTVALTILASYITNLYDGFGNKGISNTAFFACYLVIIGIVSTSFYDVAECVAASIENISLFMRIIVPIVITTLLSSGAILSAAILEPTLIAIVEISVAVVQKAFIPIIMITSAMNIVNNLSDKFKTKKLVKFINQCIKWGLCVMLTIFVSVVGLQSIASGGSDGLTIKLTKFAASNLIPVVGGILSESVETVMNCSILIKNTVGVLGIICVIIIALSPLLRIGAILIIYRLTVALIEPVSDPKIVDCITELGNSISVMFSILASTTVMFVIVLTIMINAGNSVIMLGR